MKRFDNQLFLSFSLKGVSQKGSFSLILANWCVLTLWGSGIRRKSQPCAMKSL